MKKTFLLTTVTLTTLLTAGINFADSPVPPTSPTKASHPVPSLQKTQNIDTVLSEKVQTVIAKLPALKNQAVTAASRDQEITLEGSVETKQQEEAAIEAAYSVKGVKHVKSQLTIK